MEELLGIVLQFIAAFIVIGIFQFIKALTSTIQGDNMPKMQGRLTLNPFKHFEPIGYLLLVFAGIGWGKPVQISAGSYKDKKTGIFITFLSPIVVSLLLTLLLKGIMGMLIMYANNIPYISLVYVFLGAMRNYLVTLAVINLIPVYPLCGEKLIRAFLSPNAQLKLSQNTKIFQMVLIFLMLMGVLRYPIDMLTTAILTVI